MRYWRRLLTVGLSVLSLLALSFTAITISAGAATPPSSVNQVVSVNGTLTDPGCPSFAGISPTPAVFNNFVAALNAETSGQTVYVCAGTYNLASTAYQPNDNIVITKAVTIDGTNWNTSAATSINASTQSEITGGAGIKVQVGGVTINGITFDTSTGISVRSNITGAGDQGEPNVTIENSLFSTISTQDGDIHFGLGQDFTSGTTTPDVTALDAGDTVSGNVFNMAVGTENNAVELSDTTGASITGNTVNYPTNNGSGSDDNALTALWLDGLDQNASVTNNVLNGGGIDNDSGATVSQADPKSGIKLIDNDANGPYGNGCSSQTISGNTISGFVYGIAVISESYAGNGSLCSVGPTGFFVTNNHISNSRVYGIYLSGTHNGTVTGNVATSTDTEACTTGNGCSTALTAGQYDFFDANSTVNGSASTTNAWSGNSGSGTSSPSGIGETVATTTTTVAPTTTTTSATTTTTVPATTTTTSATTTTTVPATTTTTSATTTTTVPTTTTTAGAPPATTTTTSSTTTTTSTVPVTTTTVPPTTTTTAAPKPVVTVPTSVHLKGTKIVAVVHCARARCAGIVELTKVIRFKAEIGKTGKFHIVSKTLLLGKTGYATGANSAKSISIALKGAGWKLVESLIGHKFTALLTITSAGGATRHESVTFTA